MTAEVNGVIDLDVRDSVPDWTLYLPPRAPEGSANVVYIVWDDAGLAAFNCFGSPVIETPAMDRLADDYRTPFRFGGDRIRLVAVDVSGEPIIDLEREFRALLARD